MKIEHHLGKGKTYLRTFYLQESKRILLLFDTPKSEFTRLAQSLQPMHTEKVNDSVTRGKTCKCRALGLCCSAKVSSIKRLAQTL